jgi:crossover junction endodeoxyribonuclease RuvC
VTRILGVDPSLTGTGLALVDTNDRLVVETSTFGIGLAATSTLYERRARLLEIRDRILDRAIRADFVVIEGPSLAQRAQRGTFDRAGLWWMVVDALLRRLPLVEVSPKGRAKYATGNGNSDKAAVMAAARVTYPHVAFRNDNECDALILAAMGARAISRPIDDGLSAKHTNALLNVHWPDLAALR